MTFWEHLGELRTRLFRSFAYLAIGACVGWYLYPWVHHVLAAPVQPAFNKYGVETIYLNVWEPFFLRFAVGLISGLVCVMPFLTAEMWGFISPALLPQERRWVRFVAPLSVLFFALGVLAGYLVMGPAVTWFLGYLPPGDRLMQNANSFLIFECKCILAFGLVFQLPVVLMFLAMVGLVKSSMLEKQWRAAVCILTLVAAVVTPSNDPVTMMAMAVPLVILYFLSIGLVRITERMTGRGSAKVPVAPVDRPSNNGSGPMSVG